MTSRRGMRRVHGRNRLKGIRPSAEPQKSEEKQVKKTKGKVK